MSDVPLCDLCFEEATCEVDGQFRCEAHADHLSGDGDNAPLT